MSAAAPAPPYPSHEELLAAYRATQWTVQTPGDSLVVRMDGARPDPLLRPAGIVTAYNPASIHATPEENAESDAELLRHVRSLGVPFRRCVARAAGADDHEWEEPGYTLLGDVRPLLIELGLVFGQNAVLWIDENGAVSLVCTRAGFAGCRPGQKIAP